MRWLAVGARASVQGSAHPRDPVIADWYASGSGTASGISITPDNARRLGAVYACVRLLAETIAALPLSIYKLKTGGKEKDTEHPLFEVLRWKPNRRQTSFEWREMMMGHLALRGDAYSQIILAPNGYDAAELVPLHPDRVTEFEAPDGRLAFSYSMPGERPRILLDDEVLRFPGWHDSLSAGLSRSDGPAQLHRETLGLAGALQSYSARFFGNGAQPLGVLKMPSVLGPDASKKLREDWERRHQGSGNSNRLAILDGGMDWQTIGVNNEQAQFIESRKLSVIDICRIWKIPPHKIGSMDAATFSNIEHQAIEFVTDTLLPIVVRMEQRMNLSLLTPEGRRTHYIGYDLKGLLRGDSTTRANFYRSMFQMGTMSQNDIRRLEEMDEITGGDVYFLPLNMAPSDRLLEILLKPGAAPVGGPGGDPNADPGAAPKATA